MMREQRCSDCKHLGVIISQMSDYFCYKKRIYMNIDDLSFCCDDFIFDELTLEIKEKRVW